MADNPKLRGIPDNKLVSTQDHELRYWTEKFNCTEQELRNAIAKVGNSVGALKKHFGYTA